MVEEFKVAKCHLVITLKDSADKKSSRGWNPDKFRE